jgi:transposase InsO family protein
MEPGELTHINLWGKYDMKSINGNQYYLKFIDDTRRYTIVNFLKRKDEAAQGVVEYLMHLKMQGKFPKAIRIDSGKEFVNEMLKAWCCQNSIDIQMTAPYSPSQNGIAEQMNRTIVLARAMIKSQDLLEYL